jgi:hypothetical protein
MRQRQFGLGLDRRWRLVDFQQFQQFQQLWIVQQFWIVQ